MFCEDFCGFFNDLSPDLLLWRVFDKHLLYGFLVLQLREAFPCQFLTQFFEELSECSFDWRKGVQILDEVCDPATVFTLLAFPSPPSAKSKASLFVLDFLNALRPTSLFSLIYPKMGHLPRVIVFLTPNSKQLGRTGDIQIDPFGAFLTLLRHLFDSFVADQMQGVVERKQVLEELSLLLGQHKREQLFLALQMRGSVHRRFHASQSIRNYILILHLLSQTYKTIQKPNLILP